MTDVNQFIYLIGAMTIINNVLVEFVKKEITNKNTTLVALITSMIIVCVAAYFKFLEQDIVLMILLGLATGVSSTVGYDKIKQCYKSIIEM